MPPLPKKATAPFCPSEVTGSVQVPTMASRWTKGMMVFGPGFLISIGYIDPGNWATDITAGSRYGYDLLFIILLSNIAAIFLQMLSVRVGIVTGKDLARLSRQHYPRAVNLFFWLIAELSIVACDIAEVLGGALAFHLLFGCSLTAGILITSLDTIIVLGLQGRGFRQVEAIILGLLITVGLCFMVELVIAGPNWLEVMRHMLPMHNALASPDRLYLAIGIIGATVMPHNLYLHSSLVQTRKFKNHDQMRKEMIFYNGIDTFAALLFAFLINAAILILAAATFHKTGQTIEGIEDAYRFLTPMLGTTLAAYVFGIGLLASGQSSTFTGTIAGQVILEGYLDLKIPCWVRRFITRGLALVPALIGILLMGDKAVNSLLVFSQVVLGLQLPFVMYPLFRFAQNRQLMGVFTIGPIAKLCAWTLFFILALANLWLLREIIVS